MNRLSLCAAATLLATVSFAAKADTVVNLNATVNNGTAIGGTPNNLAPTFFTTLNLAAGTYTVSLIGAGVKDSSGVTSVYNGWSQAENTTTGLAAAQSWQERTGFSTGGTTFSNAGGNDVYSPYPNANDQLLFKNGTGSCSAGNCYDSAAQALAAFANSTYTFTLASATAVTFYIPDQSYPVYPGFTDNTGGVSLDVKAVTPEPSSLVLLGTGILGVAGAARRRFLA